MKGWLYVNNVRYSLSRRNECVNLQKNCDENLYGVAMFTFYLLIFPALESTMRSKWLARMIISTDSVGSVIDTFLWL